MQIYSLFHINTSFSSIDKRNLKIVLKKCYWPLLNLISNNKFNISIEATGSSLIDINKIDENWIIELKNLLKKNKCDFVAGGLNQIISPLIPYEVNLYNLKKGNEIYNKLLGYIPKIAYVNEQTYSKSMNDLYIKAGFKKIILEWENSLKANQNVWKNNFKKHICYSEDINKNKIDIIWNSSTNFQKFQRYIHGNLTLNEFIKNLNYYKKNDIYSLYGSDAEIFNFRPKRYQNEQILENNEWKRMENLFNYISKDKKYKLSLIKKLKSKKIKINKITNAAHPIIVKKQNKYNVIRWALTGHDDVNLNSFCWKLYKKIKDKKFDYLCSLWASDLRTNITKTKWNKIKKIIYRKEKEKNFFEKNLRDEKIISTYKYLKNKNISIKLNTNKGLVLDEYIDKNISSKSLFGKLPQGYMESIDHNVDYFSGHFTNEINNKKISDLNYKIKKISLSKDSLKIVYKNSQINYTKQIKINHNGLNFKFEIKNTVLGSARLFYISLNPNLFDLNNFFYACKNGGNYLEKFFLKDSFNFNHGEIVSNIVSAKVCLGCTDGFFYFGDNEKYFKIKINKELSSVCPMMQFYKKGKKFVLRIFFSISEIDDTKKNLPRSYKGEINLESFNKKFIKKAYI
jgi:hypothetical protein